jgi:hypothetical protein
MNQIFAEPEMLGRKDAEHGKWDVEHCEPRRGIPATSITGRQMRVPTQDTEQARVIRAHEMMHAKVSPAGDWEQWQKRGIATVQSLTVAEELRVNYLCKKAGFDVMNHLSDGGEIADGERFACTNDWAGAVRMAIACAGTASSKQFLTGVRRHNRLWGQALLDISKRALKEMDKAHATRQLASTEVHAKTGLAPVGFIFTEKIAEWIDRLAGMEPPSEDEEESESTDDTSSMTTEGDEKEGKREHSNKGVKKPDMKEQLERLKTITPDRMNSTVPFWGELVTEKLPMPIQTKGNLGKTKRASNVGKSPRRIHRYMTDPERRIFDNKKRGMGGVVVIDCSGSMSLSHEQVRLMVESSPGATVIAYSDMDNCNGKPNSWVLADKGRMVEQMPEMGAGNGVDFPALEWAVKHRQHSTAPVVWVTDGGVCGPNQGFSKLLANQCTSFCKEKRIIVVPHADEAIETLNRLKAGRTARRQWPYMLRDAWNSKNADNSLQDDEIR